MKILYSLLGHNHHHCTPLYSKYFQEAFSRVMEEKDNDAKRIINKVTMDNLFQYPISINSEKKYANKTNDKQIDSDIHAETIK